ncbi:MAG TPA: type II toxin-antitoxin system HipA family toxin [Microthrixaceae bacterium]|nr:type II toxin-antitoxin system HipA family toxin [Microthrixaceae bacterium]
MTSEYSGSGSQGADPKTAYVWIWLPDATEPVVCGRLDDERGVISFTYARSYRDRADAIALYEPELPLEEGAQFAASGDRLPLCIDDSMPDSWGRRLVNHRLGEPNSELSELTYLLESNQDRIGALEFHRSPDDISRAATGNPSLTELAAAAERIDQGLPIDEQLNAALVHGTSIGGARPKSLLDGAPGSLIAKFSSSTDTYPVVQGEFVAMKLASLTGLDVAGVELARANGRYTLLVERFDRDSAGHRRHLVSALTILKLTAFPEGRYATYIDLADQIRAQFVNSDSALRELFARISFNILCGNTDDHGRNHAAFVGPGGLEFTPAYDICPQARSGNTAQQAMAFGPLEVRESRVGLLIEAAHIYRLDRTVATEIVEEQRSTISDHWDDVCDQAELTAVQRDAFMSSQFLNPLAMP